MNILLNTISFHYITKILTNFLSHSTECVISILLIIYVFILKKNKKSNSDINKIAFISLVSCLVSYSLFSHVNINSTFNSYESMLYPILFTVLVFVLNFYSAKVLNKSFSFYFSNYVGSLIYIFLPLIIRTVLMFFSMKFLEYKVLVLYTDIFYTFFVFSIIFDVHKWNSGILQKKYNEFYLEALIDFPFEGTNDNELIYQWESFKDTQSNEKENNASENVINYKEIYTRRLKRFSELKKTLKNLELDQFTMRLIELSVIEQKEKEIKVLKTQSVSYLSTFMEQTSQKFLLDILRIPGFKVDDYNEEESFAKVLHWYIKKLNGKIQSYPMQQLLISNRGDDLGSATVKTALYLELYNWDKMEEELKNVKYNKDIEALIIIESIVKTHNQLLNLDNFKSTENKVTEKYSFDFADIRYYVSIDQNLFDNYKLFKDKMDEYEKLFNYISNKVYFNFYFDGATCTKIMRSEIVGFFYDQYLNKQKKKLQKKDNEFNWIEELNILLFLADSMLYLGDEKKKGKLKKEINELIMYYSEELFIHGNWKYIEYLRENYNVSNGLLNKETRVKIEEELRKTGEYKIRFIDDITGDKTNLEKEQILKNFYMEYKMQLLNDDSYIKFEDQSSLVKTKYISKIELFKIIIKAFENTRVLNVNEIKAIKEYNMALGVLWVYDKERYNELVDCRNKYILDGVHLVISRVNKNPAEFKKIDSESLSFFKNLFKNLKISSDTDVPAYNSIKYIEELGIPYTFENFYKDDFDTFSTSWNYFLNEMSKPLDFINKLIDSKCLDKMKIDCIFLYEINHFLNSSKKYDNKEKNDLLNKIIDKICKEKVEDGKYKVSKIHEYDYIVKVYKEIKDDSVKDKLNKLILSKVDSYFIKELMEDVDA